VASKSFTIFAIPNTVGSCRLGITVTRKVGGAVRRTRIKRRLRDIFRRNRQRLSPHLDLVINAHRTMDERDATGLEREFLHTFARLARSLES
jgi:ribonuclease P protein component